MTTTFIDFAGRRADGKMIPGVIPQFDGSVHASGNCAACGECVRDIVEAAARNVNGLPWPPTGANIRAGTGDHLGGLTPHQTAEVSERRYRIGRDIRIVKWSMVYEKARDGYVISLLVWYKPISDAGESGSPGFFRNHTINILGIRGAGSSVELLYTDSLRDGRRPGIPMGPKWIKASVLRKAAAQLLLDETDGVRLEDVHPGKAYCSFGITPYHEPPPPPPPPTAFPGAKRFPKPKRFKVLFERTNLRKRPNLNEGSVVRLLERGDRFDAYWFIDRPDGRFVANRAKTRWLFRPGLAFVKYL